MENTQAGQAAKSSAERVISDSGRGIDDELLYAAFDEVPMMVVLSVVAVVFFTLFIEKLFPPHIANIWVACMLVQLGARWGVRWAFRRVAPKAADLKWWQRVFVAQSAVGGAAWGLGAAALMPSSNGAELAILVGAMLSVAAVSISALASQQASMRLFAVGAVLPLAAVTWWQGGDELRVVALVLLSGLAVTIMVGRRSHIALRSLLATRVAAAGEQSRVALQQSEERYRTLVEWSPEPIAVHVDGIVAYVNPATVALFGAHSAEQLVGRPMLDFVHPDYLSRVSERRQQIERGTKSVPKREMIFLKLDGTPIVCESQGLAVMYGGRPAIQMAISDITARKQSEAALAKNQLRLQNVLVASKIGTWEWNFANNAVFFSPEWKRNLGYSDVEVANQFEEWERRAHPDDLAMVMRSIDEIRQGLLPNYQIDFRMRHADGEWHWFSSQADLLRDDAGQPIGILGTQIDVTDRRRDELALRENELRLRLALSGADLGLWDWDAQTGRMVVNERWSTMLGLDPDGTPPTADDWHSRVHPEDMPKLGELMGKFYSDPHVVEFEVEVRARHVDGRYRWILDKGKVAQQDPDGKPLRIVGTHMDITERKEAELARRSLESQLRESQKMQAIGTLAGGVAHDFNNIIAAILGNTELARQEAQDPRVLESLREIERAGKRGRDLVRQILSFSRRQPLERHVVQLVDIVSESASLLRATLPARYLLVTRCAEDIPPVLADATQIEQVVINLASNAGHAIGAEQGQITIALDTVVLDSNAKEALMDRLSVREFAARHPGISARLSVTDTGSGMDAAMLDRIFEPFFTTKPVNEGTGLGLSVVLGIVESHDGAIDVVSEVGKGTTFTIYLPVVASDAGVEPVASPRTTESTEARLAAQATAAAQSGMQSKARILYIDDDESIVFLVKRLLERRGFQVSGFSNQIDGLAALAAEPHAFDLLISDYNMPGMSGLDVVVKARAIRKDLPMAIASGFVDPKLREQAAQLGVHDLLLKETVVDHFCDTILGLVSR